MSLPRVRLLERTEVAQGTMEFQFEKPNGFDYKAGQFADYTLLEPAETDEEGNTRGFTLSSAPFEPHLACTTRMRDTAFKRVLTASPIGTELELDAPYGSFTLQHNVTRPAVFLTGGIGVTPVRSIALQANHDGTDHTIIAFCSNKRPEDSAYLQELTTLSDTSEQFKTGPIDAAMLSRYVDDLTAPIYYLSGPAGMVKAMRAVLEAAGVDDDDIRTEEFTGY